MPAADPSNVLFKIAHPDLYERNPFNVLNLPVDATAKDIRRRKEDIEAAFDAGTEADEFYKTKLPFDPIPDGPHKDSVEELFQVLYIPEKRLAYALFWFWQDIQFPNNPSGDHLKESLVAAAAGRWTTDLTDESIAEEKRIVLLHDLAVYFHLMALGADTAAMVWPADKIPTSERTHALWNEAISYWNKATRSPSFWHAVLELANLYQEPCLNYHFVHALRQQFAFAFDQINAELAIDFAKTGREADAKRQVEYMKLSQPDSDDVEGTFDDAFAGLLRQTETIVKAAREEAQRNPKDGINQANAILSQTGESLRVSRIVLTKGSTIRKALVSAIFDGVRSCSIAYGNMTKEWDNCLGLTRKLKALAETYEQEKQVDEDEKVIQRNKQIEGSSRKMSSKHVREGVNSQNQEVEMFHAWCKDSEQALSHFKTLSRGEKIRLAQPLFQSLSVNANDPDAVYGILQKLRETDKRSVETERRVDYADRTGHTLFGCLVPAAPCRELYLAGYELLSMIHYSTHIYHNPALANRQLVSALKDDILLAQYAIQSQRSSWERCDGYTPSDDMTKISFHVRKCSFFGLIKRYATISIFVNMSAFEPKGSAPLVSVGVILPSDKYQGWNGSIMLVERVVTKFHRPNHSLTEIRGQCADLIVHFLMKVVRELLLVIVETMKQSVCELSTTDWPHWKGAPRSWTRPHSFAIL